MSDELGLGQLTAADIVELMEWAVISKPTESELIARIQRSHERRETSAVRKRSAEREAQRPTRRRVET